MHYLLLKGLSLFCKMKIDLDLNFVDEVKLVIGEFVRDFLCLPL